MGVQQFVKHAFGLFPIFYKGMLPMLTIKSGMIVNTNIYSGNYKSLVVKYYSTYSMVYIWSFISLH